MFVFLQHVEAPGKSRLELEQQLLGSHVFRSVPCSSSGQIEVRIRIVAARFTSLQVCTMLKLRAKRDYNQYCSCKVHMSLGLYHVVAPGKVRLKLAEQLKGSHVFRLVPCSSPCKVRLELVQQLLGSHIFRFVVCSSSGHIEVRGRIVSARFTCLQVCNMKQLRPKRGQNQYSSFQARMFQVRTMQQLWAKRSQNQYSSCQVHMSLGLYHVVAPGKVRLESVQQLLGSHFFKFVPCSCSGQSKVRIRIVAASLTFLQVCAVQQLWTKRGQSQYNSCQVHMSFYLYHVVTPGKLRSELAQQLLATYQMGRERSKRFTFYKPKLFQLQKNFLFTLSKLLLQSLHSFSDCICVCF